MDSNEGESKGSEPTRLNQVEGQRTTSNDGRSLEDRPADVVPGFREAQQADAHAFLGDVISQVIEKYGDSLPPNLTDHNVIAQQMFGQASAENTMPAAIPVSVEIAEAVAEGSMTPVDAVVEHQRIRAQTAQERDALTGVQQSVQTQQQTAAEYSQEPGFEGRVAQLQAEAAALEQPRVVPVDLAHPFGPAAATGALPRVQISPAETTFYHREIPAGYDQDRLAAETERVLKVAEGTESLLNQEYISNWVTLYNSYELGGTYNPVFDPVRGRNKTKEEFLADLGRKVAVRGGLALAELNINNRQFEAFAGAARGVLWKENIGVLLTDTLGTTEKVFENVGRIMSERAAGDVNKGSYWREVPIDPVTGDYDTTSMHARVDTYLSGVAGLSEADIRVVKRTMERLYKVTGMVTYYTGPLDPRSGRLMDEVIMEEIDDDAARNFARDFVTPARLASDPTSASYDRASPVYDARFDSSRPPGTYDATLADRMTIGNALYDSKLIPRRYDENRYMKNEAYWEKWAEARAKAPSRTRSDGATAEGTFAPASDDPTPMRRIFYNPEHQLGERNKASELLGGTELYVRSFLHYSGMNDMDDFFDVTLTPQDGPTRGMPPVRPGGARATALRNFSGKTIDDYTYNVGRWSQQVGGAEKALSKMNDFLNAPVSISAKAEDVGNSMKKMLEVVQQFEGYLRSGNPIVLYFGTGKLVESTFAYINSNAESRKREFPDDKAKKFGPEVMNSVFTALSDHIDKKHREEAMEKLWATDWVVWRRRAAREIMGLFGDFFGIMGKMVQSDLSGR